MRSSSPVAETRMPVSTGRVSSRDAERATFADRRDERRRRAPGRGRRPPASGNGGKSSSRSVRMWNVAAPATISTSCSAARSSSVTESPGSERTTSTSSRAGSTTAPSRTTSPSSGTRSPISMSVARSSMPDAGRQELHAGERLDGAARRGGAGDGLELREQRVALRGKSSSRCLLHDSIRTTTQDEVTVIRGVDGVHNRRRARTLRVGSCAAPVHTGGGSLSAARGVTTRSPRCAATR